MKIPMKITKGDSLTWKDDPTTDNLGNIIDSTWTLTYAIRGSTILDLTATTDGSGWSTTISKAQSSALTKGFYYWQAYAEKSGNRVTLAKGRVEILEDLASATTGFDGRSQVRIDLDNVKAAIRALVTNGAVQEYSIGNRSFKKMTLSELRELESQLLFELAQEERAETMKAGLGDPNNLRVRFR